MEKMIWVAGMARAGSMWTNNVIRDALTQAGYEVLPEQVPWRDEDKRRIVLAEALPDQNPSRVYVLKTHSKLDPEIPRTHFVSTIRDVRDAMVSWMRFMNSDFERALKAAVDMSRVCDHYMGIPEDKCTWIRYEDIIQSPAATLKYICQRLGVTLTDEQIDEIVTKYTKANVVKRIAAKEQDYQAQVQKGIETNDVEGIRGRNNSIRVYDKETGFQSGHVSDYQDGDWRTILTAEQIDRLYQRLGPWLERNGFV